MENQMFRIGSDLALGNYCYFYVVRNLFCKKTFVIAEEISAKKNNFMN